MPHAEANAAPNKAANHNKPAVHTATASATQAQNGPNGKLKKPQAV